MFTIAFNFLKNSECFKKLNDFFNYKIKKKEAEDIWVSGLFTFCKSGEENYIKNLKLFCSKKNMSINITFVYIKQHRYNAASGEELLN